MQPAARLYRPHIQTLSARYDAALESSEFDAVLIGAGVPLPVHRDDQDYPYRPEPLFLQWAALQAHPGSALLYRPGRKPLLPRDATGVSRVSRMLSCSTDVRLRWRRNGYPAV